MTTQVPSRVQGQSGFEAAVNPCRHWSGDGKTGKADCANGWTALFIKVRGALLDKLGLAEDDDMPLKLAQENPTLLKALVEAMKTKPKAVERTVTYYPEAVELKGTVKKDEEGNEVFVREN